MVKKAAATKKNKLTKKQQTFCKEYLRTNNATEAAKRAGYSKNTAYCIGWENLNKPEIKAYLAEQGAKNAEKFDYKLEQHVAELRRLKEHALDDKQYSPAIKAEELIGRVMGFYIERKEVALDVAPHDFVFEVVKGK